MLSDYTASILARCEIWWNSLLGWLDNPVFGHGLGAFEQAYAPHRADHQWFLDSTILWSPYAAAGMAHNVILQILIETGLIGLLLATLFLCEICRKGMTIPILICLSLAMIEFPEQNPASAVVLACILALSSPVSPQPSSAS